MNISRNDPFDLNLCIRGLGNQLTYMHYDIFDFMYNIGIRPNVKISKSDLADLDKRSFYDDGVFENSEDRYIRICAKIDLQIRRYKKLMCSKWGINELQDLQDDLIIEQAKRFSPRLLRYKKSRNYLRVTIFYAGILTGFVDCLYTYICATTLQSYKIPLVREEQYRICDQYDLRRIDENEDSVRFINELISEIIDDVIDYDDLVEKQMKQWGGWGAIQF